MPSSRSGLRVDTNKKNDKAYADALRKHNVAVDVTIAPGLAHNILLEPIAMERVKDIAGAMLCFAVFMAASLVLLAMSVRAALIVF